MERPIIQITLTNKFKILQYCTYYLLFVILFTNVLECIINRDITEDFLVKYKMVFLGIFATIMILGSNYLRKHPQHFNYRKPITEENAKTEYTKSVNAIIILMFIAMTSFTVISISNLLKRAASDSAINWSIYPIFVSICFAYFMILFIKAFQKEKRTAK